MWVFGNERVSLETMGLHSIVFLTGTTMAQGPG